MDVATEESITWHLADLQEVQQLRLEAQQLKEEIRSLKLKEENSVLREENLRLKSELQTVRLRDEVQRLTSENQQLNQDNQRLQNQVSCLKAENAKLRGNNQCVKVETENQTTCVCQTQASRNRQQHRTRRGRLRSSHLHHSTRTTTVTQNLTSSLDTAGEGLVSGNTGQNRDEHLGDIIVFANDDNCVDNQYSCVGDDSNDDGSDDGCSEGLSQDDVSHAVVKSEPNSQGTQTDVVVRLRENVGTGDDGMATSNSKSVRSSAVMSTSEQQTSRWALVQFDNGDEAEVVPAGWLCGKDAVFWPPFRTRTKFQQAMKVGTLPDNRERAQEMLRKWESNKKVEEEGDVRPKRKLPAMTRSQQEESSGSDAESSSAEKSSHVLDGNTSQSAKRARKEGTYPEFSSSHQQTPPTVPPQNLWHGEVLPAWVMKVFNLLEQTMHKLHDVDHKLDTLMQRSGFVEEDMPPLPEGVKLFGLSSDAELDQLEDRLRYPDIFHLVVRHLSVIGGMTVKDVVVNTLKKVIDHDLSLNLSWVDTESRRGYSRLQLHHAVCEAVRNNSNCKQATDFQIKEVVKNWFRTATDRNGGRKRRMLAKQRRATCYGKEPNLTDGETANDD